MKELERRAEALGQQAQRAMSLKRELASVDLRLTALESGEAIAQLCSEKEALAVEKDALAQAFERATGRAKDAEHELRGWTRLANAPGAQTMPGSSLAASTDASPESSWERCPPQCDALEAGDCPGPDLCGRRILYVGGRERQAAHFRAFVERLNGVFLHHDGGRNESRIRLDAMIRAADEGLQEVAA